MQEPARDRRGDVEDGEHADVKMAIVPKHTIAAVPAEREESMIVLTMRRRLPYLLRLVLLLCLPVAPAAALEVTDAWVRASVPGANVGAAYMTLTSPVKAQLLSVRSPASARVEIHQSTVEDGMMRMRQLKHLDLPAGQPVTLAPMGTHLMLLDLKSALKAGDRVQLELVVKAGGQRRKVNVSAEVRPLTQ